MFGLEIIASLAATAASAADTKTREDLGLPTPVINKEREGTEVQEYKPGWLVWSIFLSAIF